MGGTPGLPFSPSLGAWVAKSRLFGMLSKYVKGTSKNKVATC